MKKSCSNEGLGFRVRALKLKFWGFIFFDLKSAANLGMQTPSSAVNSYWAGISILTTSTYT